MSRLGEEMCESQSAPCVGCMCADCMMEKACMYVYSATTVQAKRCCLGKDMQNVSADGSCIYPLSRVGVQFVGTEG